MEKVLAEAKASIGAAKTINAVNAAKDAAEQKLSSYKRVNTLKVKVRAKQFRVKAAKLRTKAVRLKKTKVFKITGSKGKVTAAGNSAFKKGSKTVTFKIVVK